MCMDAQEVFISNKIYTILQNKRMRYCRKENLSESPNHQKYWENILVSRFY